MKNKKNIERFIGLTKNEVLEELGDEFNFYPDKQWVYILKKSWWGRKEKLFLEFDEKNKVVAQYIIYTYGK